MKQWLIDTFERVAFTFAETFIALMLATGSPASFAPATAA